MHYGKNTRWCFICCNKQCLGGFLLVGPLTVPAFSVLNRESGQGRNNGGKSPA